MDSPDHRHASTGTTPLQTFDRICALADRGDPGRAAEALEDLAEDEAREIVFALIVDRATTGGKG